MKTSGNSDSELSDGLLMSMPIDQHTQIDKLAKQKKYYKE